MKVLSLIILSVVFIISLAQADDNAADLGTIVVEASRSNDTVGQMNKDVTIITSDEIAHSPAKSLPELLGEVPGVDARVNSNIKDEQIDLGQFGESSVSNALVLIDGRRINTPDLSGADLSLIDLNTIDHIEIIQGASTVLYGDNATGGVINIVTKKGKENAKPTITLTSEVDSYKGNKDGMAVSGGIPKLAYQFDYDRQQSNNYRTFNNYWANDYDSRLDYNPTDIFGVDFSQGYHLDRYRLPGALSIAQIDQLGPSGYNPSSSLYGTTSDSNFDVTPHLKFVAGDSNGEFSIFTSARKRENNFVDPGYAEAFNYETESYEFQPKLIMTTPLTDRLNNKLTTGYDYIYTREKRLIDSTGNPEDIVFAKEESHSVYLLDELTLDEHWLFNAGARGSWASYVFDQTQQTPAKFERSDTTEGYEGGVGYKYNPDSKIFVDYSHTYRLPNLDEFFQSPYEDYLGEHQAMINSGLTYQAGNQYQLGIKDQSFKNVNLGFTATEVQYKNEIYDDQGTNANYDGRTRHYSEEAEASVELFNRKIEPFANITFQQTEFIKGDYSGNQIPDVPDKIAHAGITYRPIERLSTSVTSNFTGERYGIGDDVNLFPKIKRYDTVDWNIKYGFKNVEVWLSLNNIFSAHYYTYGDSYGPAYGYYNPGEGGAELYYPAPTRNIAAGVKVKF